VIPKVHMNIAVLRTLLIVVSVHLSWAGHRFALSSTGNGHGDLLG
jgi:hypothetical protein